MNVKVLHIVKRIDIGGISTFIRNYYAHMDPSQFQFHVVSIDTGVEHGFHKRLTEIGIKVSYMPDPIKQRTFYLLDLIKKNKYDIVHAHADIQNAYYLLIAALAGTKVRISHSHTSTENLGLKNSITRKILNILSTKMVGASEMANKAVYGDKLAKKALIINNAVDVNGFSFDQSLRDQWRETLNLGPDVIVLGFVGRISYLKNVLYLNKILLHASKTIPNIRLLVVGDGESFPEMVNDLREKGILHLVTFMGNKENVNELMMAMDFLLLPSFREGLPLVLVEAQSASLMCLVSDNLTRLIHISDFINYIGIADHNLDDWLAAIQKFGNKYDRTKPMIETISNRGFNIKQEAQNISKFYSDLLKK